MVGGLRRRVLLASAVLAVLVGAVFVVLIATVLEIGEQQRSRSRSERMIATANQLERLVLDLETGARGYAITRNGVYLKPWEQASETFPVIAERLVALSRNDPVQFVRASQLKRGVGTFEATWAALVIGAAAKNPPAARTLVLSSAGTHQVDLLRRKFNAYVAAEQARSDALRIRANSREQRAVWLGFSGLGGSLVLIAVFALYLNRRVVDPVRTVTAATARLAAGQLDERVPPGGPDEIGALARNFNRMAESIERQQTELAGQYGDLERLAHQLQAVLDSTVDGIVLTDLDGNVQLGNRPMRRFAESVGLPTFGNVPEQLLSLKDRVTDPGAYVAMMERLRSHPQEVSVDEFALRDPHRVFLGFTAPVRGDQGELAGRIWTVRDVTQERELDRLKDEFVATVSHELRTPLTSMIGFLEIVRDGEAGALNEEQRRFLDIVQRASERLQRLVGDLLFVSRLDASGLELNLERGVDLGEVVADSVESSGALARTRAIELTLDAGGDLPVRADRERLTQLVGNLISNALKFTPGGGRVVARVFPEGGKAVLEVEDTGIGIPPAEHDQLFQRFFRATTASQQAVPGTGLGLAITKAIAEAHGGSISVRSAPGSGSCFRLELPLEHGTKERGARPDLPGALRRM